MTTICLVRHGQTDWNFQHITQGREDIPLNKVGMQQAAETAEFLKEKKWDAIVSSPLSRAVHTAKAISEKTNIQSVATDDELVERHFGIASGKPYFDFVDDIRSGKVEGMETDHELMNRAYTAFTRITKKYEGQNVIIVAHSHTIKAILHKIDPTKVLFTSPMANACSNFVECKNGKWEIVEYNVHEHITV